MKYLFIGNSHTYFNDMPHIFAELAKTVDNNVHVTMLTRGGMGFPYHADGEEAPFNIRYGGYDYVILQHVAHPMGDIDEMFRAGKELIALTKESGATPLLYMTWAKLGDEGAQPAMSDAYHRLGAETGTGVIPVGEVWQEVRRQIPDIQLFYQDGQHASPEGSRLIARTVFATIFGQLPPCENEADKVIGKIALEISTKENKHC